MTEVKLGKDAVTLPVGTEAERPSNPVTGMIRWNTDTDALEGYDGVEWAPISSVPISATGGTVSDVSIGGLDFRIHAFTSTGTSSFEVLSLGTTDGKVDVLIVAGGASGGVGRDGGSCVAGSGGGAGGAILLESFRVNPTSFTINVGSGGASEDNFGGSPGNNGGNSTFDGFTAIGGGGGGSRSSGGAISGNDGGSGGGGNHDFNTNGAGLQPGSTDGGFGNDGGNGFNGGGCEADGGGGAGGEVQQLGFRGVQTIAGPGLDFSSTFGDSFGENGFFAGGGGSGLNSDDVPGLGGIGGGADGPSSRVTPDPALANSGGGGAGGANGGEGNTPSGDGGSGIVLIRYRI